MLNKKMVEKINIDKRIHSLVQKCASKRIRSLFVIHGSKSVEQVMPIYLQIISATKDAPSILWCHKSYSKDISDLRRSIIKNKKLLKAGKKEMKSDFEGFLASSLITFSSFDESHNILGQTYDFCIIQDFQSVTPNTLCRTVETVAGGGSVIILFPNCERIKDIEDISLDMHKKLRTYQNEKVNSSYMKRFLISLTWCKTGLILNDMLEVCTEFSANKNSLKTFPDKTEKDNELQNCIDNLDLSLDPLPRLIRLCKTLDQAKAVIKMVEILQENNAKLTVSLTASRGRGKSAALGLATAAAIYLKTVNIYVVAPSPDNLSTYFQFLLKGFDALEYVEDAHYCINQAVNPNFDRAIIGITVFRENRQYIQYLEPSDYKKLSHASLVLIDEAAAIPLTQVKSLIGPYNVFMASTINGYEGTGRSFSLKLLADFRQQSIPSGYIANPSHGESAKNICRPFHELTLEKSIRYATNDPVESWLYDLLCLNATSLSYPASHLPAPSECELYFVNKNFLFSGSKSAEIFLKQIMSLLVASHYKNKPDDLLILSDSTSHHLFVLVSAIPDNEKAPLPTIFSILQVCCEGGIPHEEAQKYNSNHFPNGDLIPWSFYRYFKHLRDSSLTTRKCLRIVRLATNPDYQSMGYGSKAVNLLIEYYKKEFVPLESIKTTENATENILLTSLTEREPEHIDYIGVSYGITPALYKFWNKLKFSLIFVSQIQNEITGECNCIMIYPLEYSMNEEAVIEEAPQWPIKLYEDFSENFKAILSFEPLRFMNLKLATGIMNSIRKTIPEKRLNWEQLEKKLNCKDIRRLELYSKRQADRFLIIYLLSRLSDLYFTNRLHSKFEVLELSFKQSALLVSFGFQGNHIIEDIAKKLDSTVVTTLALLNSTIAKIYNVVAEVQKAHVRADILANDGIVLNLPASVGIDLEDAIEEFAAAEQENEPLQKIFSGKSNSNFSIKRKSTTMTDEAFNKAVATVSKKKKNKRKKH